ncbi:MAG TPA: hypothetical protein ENI27_06730 [bacterium]|nr:hypothetical protein [bacterium]
MISEKQWEKALQWMVDNAVSAAAARAERIQLEKFEKVLLAKLRKQSSGKTVQERDDYALTHAEYEYHLEGYRIAVEADETFRWKKDTAQALNDAFRTQCANTRGM